MMNNIVLRDIRLFYDYIEDAETPPFSAVWARNVRGGMLNFERLGAYKDAEPLVMEDVEADVRT